MSPIEIERRVDCQAQPAAIWPLLVDTERVNRAVGLAPVTHSPHERGAARYVVQTVAGGFALRYEELPFEWVENEWFRVRRVVQEGAVREMVHELRLRPRKQGGTRVRIKLTVTPRWPVLASVIRYQVGRFAGRLVAQVERINAQLGGATPEVQRHIGNPAALAQAANALRERLGEDRKALGERLIEHIVSAADARLNPIRPFELADEWEADSRAVLAVCLHAVVSGLLEFSWDVVCPSCRTAAERFHDLASLPERGRCHLCDIRYDLDLDRAIEAVFTAAAGVRTIDPGPYCIGGPARFPHVLSQSILESDGEVVLAAPLEPGRYRLFARGGAVAQVLVGAEAEGGVALTLQDGRLDPAEVRVQPGADLVVQQATGDARHVKLERSEWANRAATAYDVSTLPEFRRLFSSQVLRSGSGLRVARAALLFSDLAGSTAMFSEVGDARAFRFLHHHLEVIGAEIERFRGTIVKTIGDAIMAAFADDEAALRASIAMQQAYRRVHESTEAPQNVRLRVGIFAGPCYAVTANGVLDYFGHTVNTAARNVGVAEPGQIVIEQDLARRAQAEGWLEEARIVEHFKMELKGVAGEFELCRVVVAVPDEWD